MTEIKASTVRPGLLINMKTSITGNMKYTSAQLDNEIRKDGSKFTKWEGTCTVFDPAEHERATKVRSNASGYIIAATCYTNFGLLCPDDKVEGFKEALAKARAEVDEFNGGASYSFIRLYVMVGRIAANDAEALESITGEVRNLISTMEEGVKNADVKKIRDAALAARQLGGMLTDKAREEVKLAIDAARSAATKYAKAGEAAAKEIDLEAVKLLATKRRAFLDLSGITEVKAPVKASKRVVELPVYTREEFTKNVAAAITGDNKVQPKKQVKVEVSEKDLGDIPAPAQRKRGRKFAKLEVPEEFADAATTFGADVAAGKPAARAVAKLEKAVSKAVKGKKKGKANSVKEIIQ